MKSALGLLSGVVLLSSIIAIVGSSSLFAALKPAGWAEKELRNGLDTAYDWDYLQCRQSLLSTSPNVRNTTFPGGLREYFNRAHTYNTTPGAPSRSISYKTDTWISLSSQGNISSPIIVEEGDSTIDFRVNFVMFLCGNLVSPDLTSGCSANLGTVTGGFIANDAQRWVTLSPPNQNDRAPNPVGNTCMRPTRTNNAVYMPRVTVQERKSDGTWTEAVNINLNAYRETPRDNNSRYWQMPPIPFTYNRPGGFTENTRLRFTLYSRKIDVYGVGGSSMVYYRENGDRVPSGGTIPYPGLSAAPWNDVRELPDTYQLQVMVNPQPRVSARVAITPKPAMDGQTINASHSVNNPSRTQNTVNVRYGLFHDRNGNEVFNSGIDTIISQTTATRNSSAETINAGSSSVAASAALYGEGQVCAFTEITSVTPGRVLEGSTNPVTDCTRIGKVPLVQISGGDLIARGTAGTYGIVTATTQIGSRQYGSWGEYGLLAARSIDSVSGGALTGRGVSGALSQTDRHRLTFANQSAVPGNPPGNFALGDNQLRADDILHLVSSWGSPVDRANNSININSLSNKRVSRLTSTASPIRILQSENLTGQRIIDARGKTLRIDGNVTYADGQTDAANMPQLIIIADRIFVQSGVNRIDAWLISSDGMSTCGASLGETPYYAGRRIGNGCDRLTVNGITQASRLLLRRTGGADGATSQSRQRPAEVFNGRSDAHLWAYSQAAGQGVIRTETVRELPPRF